MRVRATALGKQLMFNEAVDRAEALGQNINIEDLKLEVPVMKQRNRDQTVINVYKDGQPVGCEKILDEE